MYKATTITAMSLTRFCLCALWLLSVACTAPEDEKPKGLINEDKMVGILSDVHMAEAQVSQLGLSSIDSSNMAYKHLETGILKKFGTDTATYRISYLYYSAHPRDMAKIYEQVVKNIQKKMDTQRPGKS